jgi:hypothetical protein
MRQWCSLNCTTTFNTEFRMGPAKHRDLSEARRLPNRGIARAVECCTRRNKNGGDDFSILRAGVDSYPG